MLFNGGRNPPKLSLPLGGGCPDPHLIHCYWGPPHPTCQAASRSVQPFLQDTCPLHDRPTDRPRHTSVSIGRIYAMHTMRPNNKALQCTNSGAHYQGLDCLAKMFNAKARAPSPRGKARATASTNDDPRGQGYVLADTSLAIIRASLLIDRQLEKTALDRGRNDHISLALDLDL